MFLTTHIPIARVVSDHTHTLIDLLNLYRERFRRSTIKYSNYVHIFSVELNLKKISSLTIIVSVMNWLERRIKRLLTEREDKFQEYFLRTRLNILLCIEIASRQAGKDLITFEELCEVIPKYIGSRSSVLSSLREGVDRGFFTKDRSEEDKRLRIYSLDEEVEAVYLSIMEGVDNSERYEEGT